VATTTAENGRRHNHPCVVVGETDARTRKLAVRLLRQAGYETHAVGTGPAALELARTLRPAAVLLDVALPEMSGYQVCHTLRGEREDLSILLLSENRTESYDRVAGLLLGADDYIAKPFAPDELTARLVAHIRDRAARTGHESRLASLTPGERRALKMLAEGMTTKTIAHALSVTPKTVSMHVNNAMKKLDVHSRTQAVALAHRYGLVTGRVDGEAGTPKGANVSVAGAHAAAR
jgi:DNA-binding NarL/FixJ family response regulator